MQKVVHERTLIINHVIYLTPEQRNGLLKDRTPAQVVGVSVPVWFNNGKSSEPAQEVFCQYTITNEPQEMMVTTLPTGYRINLPQPKKDGPDPETLQMYGMEAPERIAPDMKKLGDVKDGGSGWLLFKQFQTITHEEQKIQALHYIELRDEEYYLDCIRSQSGRTAETSPSAC